MEIKRTRCGNIAGFLFSNEFKELITRGRVAAEAAEHGGCYHAGVLFFHTAHHHAEMLRFNHHTNAFRGNRIHQGGGNFVGKTFLDLEASGEVIDNPRQLTDAQYLAFGNIADMALSKEGKHVMFAQAVELYIFDNDHVIVFNSENGVVDDVFKFFAIALGQEVHGFGRTFRGVEQAFAFRIFTDFRKNFFIEVVHENIPSFNCRRLCEIFRTK